MRSRYWLLTTTSTILITVAAVAALNMTVDIYGLYRAAGGRSLPVYGDERVAKYLLSMRYVPGNFNAVLSGASVSANWDVSGIEQLRVYNESLDGGNIAEEKSLIEAALERPGISAALLLVHPAMTVSHEFHTVDMRPELARSALGSVSLWDAYKEMAKIRLGRIPRTFDDAGTETFHSARSEMNIWMKAMWSQPEFAVDPVALRAYLDLVARLRARGARIIFIVPPISEGLRESKQGALDRYLARMRAELGAGGLWMDFLSPEYQAFREDKANFSDGVHTTSGGARQVIASINSSVSRWIAERQLVVAKR